MTSLTSEEKRRRQELTDKLQTRTLNTREAEELRQILEKEKEQATSVGDVLAVLVIAILIGLVIAYVAKK